MDYTILNYVYMVYVNKYYLIRTTLKRLYIYRKENNTIAVSLSNYNIQVRIT